MAPAIECAACYRAPTSKAVLSCSVCKLTYDIKCVSVTFKRFNLIEARYKANWQCPACYCEQPKSDNTNTPVRPCSIGTSKDDDQSNVTLRTKKKNGRSFVHNVQSLKSEEDQNAAMRQEISNISSYFEKLFLMQPKVSIIVATSLNTVSKCSKDIRAQSVRQVTSIKLGAEVESRDIVSVERVGLRRMADEDDSGDAGRPLAMVMQLTRRVLRDELLCAACRA
ncbi:hypothetical protein EVAR_70654_1 [Eumeta japonica]|uniref:Zinc finger PHD-type domain-containing protein n=1 Tax=Eumeta variegata TaxID=151549 RepID=A0A4C1TAV7_EUMVA|nr:hypothetical protein EVAR_70654_1 [Eumeta japonica]